MTKNRRSVFLCFIVIVYCTASAEAKKLPAPLWLWNGIEGMELENTQIYVYEASKHNRTETAVIICPGGSYHHLDIQGEGVTSAEWFQSIGITAFILKYRVSREGYHFPAMLQDFQRAVQYIRENAKYYRINPHKLGAIGYSAGGHLVLMGGIYGDTDNELSKMGIKTSVSLRPDFIMPIYPVVSMRGDIAHRWSRWSLLGKNEDPRLKEFLSLENHIAPDMIPVFNIAALDDRTVDCRNSIVLHEALLNAGVQHFFRLYEWGGHGFGMKDCPFMKACHWNETLLSWIKESGFID